MNIARHIPLNGYGSIVRSTNTLPEVFKKDIFNLYAGFTLRTGIGQTGESKSAMFASVHLCVIQERYCAKTKGKPNLFTQTVFDLRNRSPLAPETLFNKNMPAHFRKRYAQALLFGFARNSGVLCRLYTNSKALSAVKPGSYHIIICFSLRYDLTTHRDYTFLRCNSRCIKPETINTYL